MSDAIHGCDPEKPAISSSNRTSIGMRVSWLGPNLFAGTEPGWGLCAGTARVCLSVCCGHCCTSGRAASLFLVYAHFGSLVPIGAEAMENLLHSHGACFGGGSPSQPSISVCDGKLLHSTGVTGLHAAVTWPGGFSSLHQRFSSQS